METIAVKKSCAGDEVCGVRRRLGVAQPDAPAAAGAAAQAGAGGAGGAAPAAGGGAGGGRVAAGRAVAGRRAIRVHFLKKYKMKPFFAICFYVQKGHNRGIGHKCNEKLR